MIKRRIQEIIQPAFFKGKAIIILGPRQTGKTTLVQTMLANKEHLFLNADDPVVQQQLNGADSFRLKQIIGGHTLVFIDEVQRLKQPGITMKLITDQFKSVQLIASGSSALEIRDKTNEPLTGRKWEYHLYPISWEELDTSAGYLEAEKQLPHRIIFGMYPDVINNPGNEHKILQELTHSYLYKDILALAGIRKPDLLERLLQSLALQMSCEVSYTELAQLLQVDKATIVSYIDLLEKAFIIFRLRSFSRNHRNEIKNNRKIYFWDNGIRNMIIANLNPLVLRQDKGALWENFLVTERMKMIQYHQVIANSYFWRTTQQQEIDYIEEKNGAIQGFEFKWKHDGRIKTPAVFLSNYGTTVKVITSENFREFLYPQP